LGARLHGDGGDKEKEAHRQMIEWREEEEGADMTF
jgi:hypothetical protein